METVCAKFVMVNTQQPEAGKVASFSPSRPSGDTQLKGLLDIIRELDKKADGSPLACRPIQPQHHQRHEWERLPENTDDLMLKLLMDIIKLLMSRRAPHEGGEPVRPNIGAESGGRTVDPHQQPWVRPMPSQPEINPLMDVPFIPGREEPLPEAPGEGSFMGNIKNGFNRGLHKISGLVNRFTHLLDGNQGDNKYGIRGNCGLVSVTNVLRMAGHKVTEDDISGLALGNGLCGREGGTVPENRLAILRHYGVDAESKQTSLEGMAQAVEKNKGVIASLNAETLWGTANGGEINHAVTVTGVVRDKGSNGIKGFMICDSGHGDKARFIPYDKMQTACGGDGGVLTEITRHSLAPVA